MKEWNPSLLLATWSKLQVISIYSVRIDDDLIVYSASIRIHSQWKPSSVARPGPGGRHTT